MVTSKELAEMLRQVNVEQVAREAGVCTKTIYRLRRLQNSPRLDVAERILSAIGRVKRGVA